MSTRNCVALLLVFVALSASGDGLTPRPGAGGMVSIPGASLPPVPPGSVRTAIPIYESILKGVSIWGETPTLARGYGFLATMYASINELSKAEKLFDDAQRILERDGTIGHDLGWVYNNRGLVNLDQARYAVALRAFRSSVAALPRERQDLLPYRVVALQNFATTQGFLGDVESAEDAYLEALEILRELGEENGLRAVGTRSNLAGLYTGINDYATARVILEDLEKRTDLGRGMRFAIASGLGLTLLHLHDFPGAEARFRTALRLSDEGSANRALALMNLAGFYSEAGDFEQSRREGEEALRAAEAVYGPDGRMTAIPLGTLAVCAMARGDYVKADSLSARSQRLLSKLGGDEEALAGVLQTRAVIAQRRGERERALALAREALDLKKNNLERVLAFGSEAQRLAYRADGYPYDHLANLGDGKMLAEAVLMMKGVVLESLLAERALARASRSPEDEEELDRIHELRLELMEAIGRGEKDTEELRRALKKRETALAKRLARPVAQHRRADLASVQKALENGQVLIELIRYQLYEDKGVRTPSYGGVIIANTGDPVWVPLGSAQPIDEMIGELVSRLNGGNRGVEFKSKRDATPLLHSLDQSLWQPLAKAFPHGTGCVLLSTDSATSFVPWAALLDEHDAFLAERYEIAQVGSGRDLLRESTASPSKSLLALADGGNDLTFSRREVEAIARVAKDHDWRTTVLTNEQASEVQLFQHPRPRILHFATHAGELSPKLEASVGKRLGANPMYRGYILLGGGKRTREEWQEGSLGPMNEDGILTAEEASGLDLRDTWLTVLSACRTGAGDALTGEGVLGLRRGFALAGTENLVFSLWSVDDASTAQFMAAFYGRLFASGDIESAFHETQLDELRTWRDAGHSLSDAVERAGAFVLTR